MYLTKVGVGTETVSVLRTSHNLSFCGSLSGCATPTFRFAFQAYQNCVMDEVQSYVVENGLDAAATAEHAEELEGCVAYAGKYPRNG